MRTQSRQRMREREREYSENLGAFGNGVLHEVVHNVHLRTQFIAIT
jgi:hypothetical protein